EHRLDMLVGIVVFPGIAIDLLPLLSRHSRMAGADMLKIVLVHVGIHRNPFEIKVLVVLGAGQGGQAKELEDVERQLLFDDVDVASDRLRRIGRKTKNVACPGHHLVPPPLLQHDPIFPDLVLPLLGALKRLRIDVLESDEDLVAARPRRLLDEAWDLVAERVDLKDQLDRDALVFPKIDQAIEDRFPVAVPSEIVVGDEIVVDALRVIGAHDRLDVIGAPVARLAALDIDDRAEAALEWTAAAGVEARMMADDPPHNFLRQHRDRSRLHARHVIEVIGGGLRLVGVNVTEEIGNPALALARVQGHAQRLRFLQVRWQLRKHRYAARDVESADHHGHAFRSELARKIKGARKLIRLNPDEPDKSTPRRFDLSRDLFNVDDRVALVAGVDLDVDVGAESPLLGALRQQSIDAREAIRGNSGEAPLDHVAVVVIVRRLDKKDLERPLSHTALLLT